MNVSIMDTSSSERIITMIFDYYLICDKVRRKIMSYQRYTYDGLGIFALNVVEWLQNSVMDTFKETFKRKWSQRWLKKHIYGLVSLLK